jgi:hypothetical protein
MKTWIRITASLMLVAMTSVGVWAVIDKLDDATFKVLVGAIGTLVIVVVVGALFIGHGLVQAYIARRLVAQDDLNDMRQMAFMARLMGGSGKVNVQLPSGQQAPLLPYGQQPQAFSGAYRDAIVEGQVEVE